MLEDSTPAIGDVIAGKYRIEHVLGRGGMGTVFAARHTVTDRELAIKWLRPELARDPEWMRRFVGEARAAGRVHHDNVVDVYDVDEHDGAIFLVMERLHGRPLSTLLEGGALPVGEALALLLPAMRGMRALHQRGVIHRDLKPANIFVCEDPAGEVTGVKVLDFGISKILDAGVDAPTLTETGARMGTPNYMAPEQLAGDVVLDQRVDVFAFAVVLYRALAGRQPFASDSAAALVLKIATQDPPPLHVVVRSIPEELGRVVAKAMARDRAARYADLGQFLCALEPCCDGRERPTSPSAAPRLRGDPRSDDVATPPASARSFLRPAKRPSWPWVSVLVMALGGVTAWASIVGGRRSTTPATRIEPALEATGLPRALPASGPSGASQRPSVMPGDAAGDAASPVAPSAARDSPPPTTPIPRGPATRARPAAEAVTRSPSPYATAPAGIRLRPEDF